MKIHNKSIIVSYIIILIILLLCLPNIIDLIPSRKVKYVITVVFCLLVFLFLVYITYNDIRKREYTTTVYIVLLEIIGIVVYVIGSYSYFHKTDVSDIEVLLRRSNIQAACLFYILCESIVITFLKRDTFKKKQ